MVNSDLSNERREYQAIPLTLESSPSSPIALFEQWFEKLAPLEGELDKTALVLSTVDKDGFPDARVVLLKGLSEGKFLFYTNYQSQKGQQLLTNNRASMTFYWPSICKQVRIRGLVDKVSAKLSDEYFSSRPIESQLGAIASHQSQVIESRKLLEEKYLALKMTAKETVKRPENWGGYALIPLEMEFWAGRSNRLHDRIKYIKNTEGMWKKQRLQP